MIGGDVLINDMKMRHANDNGNIVLFKQTSDIQLRTFFETFNLLMKSGVATDPYLIGSAMNTGVIQTFFFVICLLFLTELSFFIFIHSWIYERAYTYDQIWKELFGSHFSWLIQLLVIITYLSFVIWNQYEQYAYYATFMNNVFPNTPSIVTNHWLISYLLTFVVIVPTLFVKRLSNFTIISMISNFCHILSIICLITFYIRVAASDFEKAEVIYFSSDSASTFHTISILNSSLFFHPLLYYIIRDMENPTRCRAMKLTWITSISSCILHFVGGIFSYLCYPNDDGDCIFFYFDSMIPEIFIGQIATYIISILSSIFFSFFLAEQVSEFVYERSTQISRVPVLLSGISMILLGVGLNFITEVVTTITDLIGSITCVLLTFILPPIYYLKQYKLSNKLWGIMCVILLLIGIPVGACTIYYAF
ncbi:Transmembrane amino acid transporter protein [Tritrichomonas foetus]|uniref:Transmembrane amino acid transporter protein n=1 Tax=Tritrichomonas foetus TaxID=1144522 RepID=A0A1J4JWA4_9EUKA|nr:Transmembrane amino acid transporter protein [Tritrichomonas foetus]|eukprot:OHT02994.1 Transmembrane amino acid transporter protein [Tritrichomonas foetus]